METNQCTYKFVDGRVFPAVTWITKEDNGKFKHNQEKASIWANLLNNDVVGGFSKGMSA